MQDPKLPGVVHPPGESRRCGVSFTNSGPRNNDEGTKDPEFCVQSLVVSSSQALACILSRLSDVKAMPRHLCAVNCPLQRLGTFSTP